jgi:hypothetical protein
MIYKNGKLILEVQNNMTELVDQIEKQVQRKIGAIRKGSQLIWLTVYNEIFGVFGSGVWLQDRPWKGDELWKNN